MKHTKSESNSKKEAKLEKEVDTNNSVEKMEADAKLMDESSEQEKLPVETELEAAKREAEEWKIKYNQINDTYLRSLAEFDNYRKRSLREKADLIKTGGESVLISVLTVIDDMERGLSSTKEAQDIEAVKQGMELIYSKFQNFLKQCGIKAIETEGKTFDTDLHEAITTFPAPSEELKGKVVDCVQKGYYLHDKVIRFAKVVVGE